MIIIFDINRKVFLIRWVWELRGRELQRLTPFFLLVLNSFIEVGLMHTAVRV